MIIALIYLDLGILNIVPLNTLFIVPISFDIGIVFIFMLIILKEAA